MPKHITRTKREQLTEKAVSNLAAGCKRADGNKLAGRGRLIVRAKATLRNGTVRQFFFRYWDAKDTERMMLIGRHGDGKDGRTLTLNAARAKANTLSEQLQEGKDPKFQRLMQVEANRTAEQTARESVEREARKGTLSDLIASYVSHLKANGKTSATDTEKTLSRHVLKPFPQLAARRARDITAADISDVMLRMIEKGIKRRTNIVRSMLRAAFAFGAGMDNDPLRRAEALKAADGQAAKLFGIAGNPVADIKRIGKYDRALERTLSDAELVGYIHDIDTLHPAVGGALKAALFLGGQRMSQLLRAKWTDYDADERLLWLKDSKGRGGVRQHILPVTEGVAVILASLKASQVDDATADDAQKRPYIFSTRRGTTPVDLSTLSNAVAQIAGSDKDAYGAADIRRTVETRLAALGVSKKHRAQLLSHGRTQGVQERHYDMHDYVPEKAAALARWAHLTELIEGKTNKVIRARFRDRA